MTSKHMFLIFVALLVLSGLATLYIMREVPADKVIVTLSEEDILCSKNDDCTIAQINCCDGCGAEMVAVNKGIADKINNKRKKECPGVCRIAYDCIDTAIVLDPLCIEGKCVIDRKIDCSELCPDILINRSIEFELRYLGALDNNKFGNLTSEAIDDICNCDKQQ